ncbi:MAG: GNAT family N-acetyltransferase [Clostridia bacterium]|nr:GNAT family N-acetyltransferase [Clostridia bacterium]
MGELILTAPTLEYETEILAFRREMLAAQDEDGFAGCSRLEKYEAVEDWLDHLAKYASAASCPNGKVPSDTYLAVRVADDRVVGIIDLRHHIDHPILSLWGGHIGYSVRPSERGHGYAAEMLRLNLEICRGRGMKKILITCSPDNPASEKTIRKNGGVWEKDIVVDGDTVRRFWITLQQEDG